MGFPDREKKKKRIYYRDIHPNEWHRMREDDQPKVVDSNG